MADQWDAIFTTIITGNREFRVEDIESTTRAHSENHLKEIVKIIRKSNFLPWPDFKESIQRVESTWPREIFVLDEKNEFDINFEVLSDNTSSEKYVERLFIVFWIIRLYFNLMSSPQGGRRLPVPPYGWEPDYRCDYGGTLEIVRRVFEKTKDLKFKEILDELTPMAEQIDKWNETPKRIEDKSTPYYISMMKEQQEHIERQTVKDEYVTLRELYSSIDATFPGEESVYKLYELIEQFFSEDSRSTKSANKR